MSFLQSAKNIGTLAGALAIVAALSYCSERPKYQFEKIAIEAGKGIPGARLIDSFKSGDLASPISWIWPATTTWVYAVPDPKIENRFLVVTLAYGEKDPMVLLEDIDCTSGQRTLYSAEDSDNTTPPARDMQGNPVVAANGKTFRRFDSDIAVPRKQLNAYCNTNWSAERTSVRAAH